MPSNLSKNAIFQSLIFTFFITIVFFLKRDSLSDPVWWDEIENYYFPSLKLFENFWQWIFTYFKQHGFLFFHPPGFPALLTIPYKVFGANWIVARHSIFFLFYAPMIWFTWKICIRLHSFLFGLFVCTALTLNPLIFSSSALIHPDLPLTALSMGYIYFLFQRNFKLFVLFGIILSVFRFTAIGILLISFFVIFFESFSMKSLRRKWLWAGVLPILVFVIFNLSVRLISIDPNHPGFAHISLSNPVFELMKKNLNILFWSQGRYALSLCLVFSSTLLVFSKKWNYEIYRMIFIGVSLLIGFLSVFMFHQFVLFRYFIPIFPFLFIFSGLGMFVFFRHKYLIFLLLLPMFFAALPTYNPSHSDYGNSLDQSLEYRRAIKQHKEAAEFLSQNYPNAKIAAIRFPYLELKWPSIGYVSKALNVNDKLTDDFDLFIFTSQGAVGRLKEQRDFMDKHPMKLVKSYHNGTHFYDIYLNSKAKE